MNIGQATPTGGSHQASGNEGQPTASQINRLTSPSIVPTQPSTAAAVQSHHRLPPSNPFAMSIVRTSTPNGRRAMLWVSPVSGDLTDMHALDRREPTNELTPSQTATEQAVWETLTTADSQFVPLRHQQEGNTTRAYVLSRDDFRVTTDPAGPRRPALRQEHEYQIALRCRGNELEAMYIKPQDQDQFAVHYRPPGSQHGSGSRLPSRAALSSTASQMHARADRDARVGRLSSEDLIALSENTDPADLARALVYARTPQDRPHILPEYSGASNASGSGQALTSEGAFSQASGSAGAPARRHATARHYHWTAPYAGPSSQPSGSAAASGASNASGSGQALTSRVDRPEDSQSSARASLTHAEDLAAFDDFAPRARAAGLASDPSYFAAFLRDLRQRGLGMTWEEFRNSPEDERNKYLRDAVADGYLNKSVPAIVRRAIDPQFTIQPRGTSRDTLTHPEDLAAFDEFAPRARAAGYPNDPGRLAAFLRDLRQHGQGMTWEQFRNRPQQVRDRYLSEGVTHRNLNRNVPATVRRALNTVLSQ